MPEKKLFKNYLYHLTSQMIIILVPLITIPYLSRVLSPDGIGIKSYTFAIQSIFALFASLGTCIYGEREVALHADDKEAQSKVFWNVTILRIITTTIGMVAYFWYTFRVAGKQYRFILLLQSVNLLDLYVEWYWFFSGQEDFKQTSLRNSLAKLGELPFVFLFVKSPDDLWKYVLYIPLATFILSVSYLPLLKERLVPVPKRDLHPFAAMGTILMLFLPQIAENVFSICDKVMIGSFCADNLQNGYYEQAYRIIMFVIPLLTAMGTVSAPRIANLHAKGERKAVEDVFLQSFNFVCLFSFPLMVGIIMLSSSFVPLYLGDAFRPSIPILNMLSLLLVIVSFNALNGGQYLIPTKRETMYTLSVFIGAGINICFNALLIPKHQAYGAAIGSVISESAITLIQLLYLRKEIPWKRMLGTCWKYVVASALMGIALACIPSPSSWVGLIISVLGSIIVYALSLLIIHDPVFSAFFRKNTDSTNKTILG